MKKLFACLGLLWAVTASAQFTPGQLLTAAELNSQFALYSKLAGATFTGPVTIPGLTLTAASSLGGFATTTTNGFLDNSTLVATDGFVKQSILAAQAEIPIASFTGGTYNFATAGTGGQIVVLASGGVITSILTIAVPGSGYQVGDCLVMVGGNGDAILRVTGVSGGGITSASVLYGGTGYTTGAQLAGIALPPGTRTANLNGTLTSNATIIIPSGTYLQGARRIAFNNNTVSGGFTITVKLSNGSGGSTGTGVVLPTPSNGANSASILLYTDGQNDVWPETGTIPTGNMPLSSLATQASNTMVANATGSTASPTAVVVPSCSTSSSALQWASGTGPACNTSINASSLGGTGAASYALLASPTFTGTVTTAALTSTGNFTPSQTNGIVGTTTNNNANAGSVGEYLTNSATGVSLTTGTPANATSVSLTAGDWDVSGVVTYLPNTGTTISALVQGISTTSATFPAVNSGAYSQIIAAFTTASGQIEFTPTTRLSLSSTTTVYLVAQAFFGVSTMTCDGIIRARRVR